MFLHNTWRLIDFSMGTAQWNMAVDEALLNSYGVDDLPILRLYGWESSLSLGRYSSFEGALNKKRIDAEAMPYVRRMSGGGVLVHGTDVSYTLIIPRTALGNTGIDACYHYLCGFLIRFYEKLGLNPQFASRLSLQTGKSESCLAGTEVYDIMINGEKMGGNAQRYKRNAFLQHGTVPMHLEPSRFNPLFVIDSGLQRATSLKRLGICMDYEQLGCLLKEAFSETFNVALVPDTLTPAEESCAQALLEDKYSQERWNLHAQPASA